MKPTYDKTIDVARIELAGKRPFLVTPVLDAADKAILAYLSNETHCELVHQEHDDMFKGLHAQRYKALHPSGINIDYQRATGIDYSTFGKGLGLPIVVASKLRLFSFTTDPKEVEADVTYRIAQAGIEKLTKISERAASDLYLEINLYNDVEDKFIQPYPTKEIIRW